MLEFAARRRVLRLVERAAVALGVEFGQLRAQDAQVGGRDGRDGDGTEARPPFPSVLTVPSVQTLPASRYLPPSTGIWNVLAAGSSVQRRVTALVRV